MWRLSDDTGVGDTLQLTRRVKAGSRTGGAVLAAFPERRATPDSRSDLACRNHRASRLSPWPYRRWRKFLLPGESVTTAGVNVKDGKVLVNLGPRQKA